ncbi:MAG: AAA family ATPase, partial [Anaerolineales bacterium]
MSRKQARALIYVLAMTLQPVPRDRLVFLFWPDKPEVTARRNLSRVASYIRNELPHPELLRINQESIGLNPEMVWSDAARFMELAEQSSPAKREETVALYNGSFLSGFSLPGNSEFDFWLASQQQQFEGRYFDALKDLIQIKFAAQDLSKAIHYAQRYLAIDELAEDVHQQLIRLYAASGDRSAALRQFEACTLILERELGVEPLPETRAIYNTVKSGETSSQSDLLTKPIWTVLPSLELPLVGREMAWRVLDEAYQRIQTGGVILIVGEAGVGKTRLMQEFTIRGPHTVLVGNNHSATRSLPYRPLVQALRQALSNPQLWVDIPPLWLGELTPLLPELRDHFSGLPQPLEVKPEQAQARLFEALIQVIVGLAAQDPPLLLCLDDLHWADEATLGWLSAVSQRLADSHVCILGTCRQEELDSVRGVRRAFRRAGLLAEVALAGLSLQAIGDILRQVPGHDAPRALLVARLAQTTGGNTFFVLETMRALLESGQLDAPPERLPPVVWAKRATSSARGASCPG